MIKGYLVTAFPLRDPQIEKFKRILEEVLHEEVSLRPLRDETLWGVAGIGFESRFSKGYFVFADEKLHPDMDLLRERLEGEIGQQIVMKRTLDETLEGEFALILDLATILRGEVVSAFPMDDEEITKLETEFERKMGKKVFLEAGVDKSLLGGFVCTIDKVCFDCSLRTRLVSLKEHIMAKEV